MRLAAPLALIGGLILFCAQSPSPGFPPGIFSRGAIDAASSPPPSTTTLDPSNTSSDITLSNGNLTATNGTSVANYNLTKSIAGHSTGKFYCEFIATTRGAPDDIIFGYIDATFSSYTNNAAFANGSNAGGGYAGDGNVYLGTSTGIGTYSAGTAIGMAVDLGNLTIFFTRDGVHWNSTSSLTNNPATNTGGISISGITGSIYAVAGFNPNGAVATANFGGSAYAYTPPVGFGNW
jgi:hypothetical protein